jgi:pescadillo protein
MFPRVRDADEVAHWLCPLTKRPPQHPTHFTLQEAKALLERARKLKAFTALFKGLVFFLNREVPREAFEFIICAFRGRVGWDGPGSPYAATDARITHHVVDRPMPAASLRDGREYVQPQWVADSVNARMLLPVSKYAPGAVLPPHLSPFVEDAAEGYTPAYRAELDKLRAAAAVTGRLADVYTPAPAEGAGEAGGAGAGSVLPARLPSHAGADADSDVESESGDEPDDDIDAKAAATGGKDSGSVPDAEDDDEQEEEEEDEAEDSDEADQFEADDIDTARAAKRQVSDHLHTRVQALLVSACVYDTRL